MRNNNLKKRLPGVVDKLVIGLGLFPLLPTASGRHFLFMTIDRIKISQEINFNGMPTWIGMEASILPDEDEKDCLRKLQKSITEYDNEAKKEYSKSKWAKSEPEYNDKPVQSMIEEMETCATFAEIQSFRFTVKNADEQAVYERKIIELTSKKQTT